jgi:uncharacterized membrane protein
MGISNHVTAQRVKIGPVGCYLEGKEFLGAEYGLFLGICLVGLLIGGLVPVVLYGPAFCGMALCFLARARGGQASFELLFKGFDYFVPSLIATLIYLGIAFVLIIPLMLLVFVLMAMMGSQEPVLMIVAGFMLAFVYLGWILIIAVASILFMFAILLIVDRKLEGPAAMRVALEGVTTNFWGVLACATVGQIIILVGMMMCIVPGILMVPIVFAGHFVVYRKIFGLEMTKPVMAQMV